MELDKKYTEYGGEIPEKYTVSEGNIPPPHSQHEYTTSYRCMAYATAGIWRILWKKYSGEDIPFSVAYIYGAYRREANRNGLPMFVSDLIPGISKGGAVPFDKMPDLKTPAECYDYVKSHPELEEEAEKYSEMIKGYVNLSARTKAEEFENIKKALLRYDLPLYGEMEGHGIIFVGYDKDCVLYRDSDGSNWLKKLKYKKIKESYLFVMKEKSYTDVPKEHWACEAIEFCKEKGYMKGTGEDIFSPDKVMTRSEAAQVIYNIMRER